MPKNQSSEWDVVGLVVNILVALLLLGGLIMYAA